MHALGPSPSRPRADEFLQEASTTPRTSATTVASIAAIEQDDEEGVHGAYLGASRSKANGKRARAQCVGQRAAVGARRAQVGERRRAVALGEALAVGADQQRMVVIDAASAGRAAPGAGGGRGRGEQVAAAHHVGHALRGIVDRDREMIAGRRVLARAARRRRARCGSARPAARRSRRCQSAARLRATAPSPCRAASDAARPRQPSRDSPRIERRQVPG